MKLLSRDLSNPKILGLFSVDTAQISSPQQRGRTIYKDCRVRIGEQKVSWWDHIEGIWFGLRLRYSFVPSKSLRWVSLLISP